MSMSITLRNYLESHGIRYEIVAHERTVSSARTAEAAHVPGDKLAKAVVVDDDRECLAVVVPATHRVELGTLSRQLGRPFHLASETELSRYFRDCDPGAVPAAAQAFGMPVLVEECLLECDEVYFEAGDHAELVRMPGEDFEYLMSRAGHGHFSHHV